MSLSNIQIVITFCVFALSYVFGVFQNALYTQYAEVIFYTYLAQLFTSFSYYYVNSVGWWRLRNVSQIFYSLMISSVMGLMYLHLADAILLSQGLDFHYQIGALYHIAYMIIVIIFWTIIMCYCTPNNKKL